MERVESIFKSFCITYLSDKEEGEKVYLNDFKKSYVKYRNNLIDKGEYIIPEKEIQFKLGKILYENGYEYFSKREYKKEPKNAFEGIGQVVFYFRK